MSTGTETGEGSPHPRQGNERVFRAVQHERPGWLWCARDLAPDDSRSAEGEDLREIQLAGSRGGP